MVRERSHGKLRRYTSIQQIGRSPNPAPVFLMELCAARVLIRIY